MHVWSIGGNNWRIAKLKVGNTYNIILCILKVMNKITFSTMDSHLKQGVDEKVKKKILMAQHHLHKLYTHRYTHKTTLYFPKINK